LQDQEDGDDQGDGRKGVQDDEPSKKKAPGREIES